MPYKLKLEDFDYFMPDANQVTIDQMLMLGHNILPGVNGWSGFLTQYFHPDDETILYIDERENDDHLFIGGCLVSAKEKHEILPELSQFKNTFRSENNAEQWFLKGSGMHAGVDKDNGDDALSRWILWAKFLKTFPCFYRFHSVSLNKKKFIYSESQPKWKNIERYRCAYEALFKTLEQNRHSKITVVTDNVQGAQLKGLKQAIENSVNILERKVLLDPPVPKEDFSSIDSNWLQFVDMQIYALSRFTFPSGRNVLMDFEKYSYDVSEGDFIISSDPKELMKQRIQVSKYFILKDIFHHLRLKFVTRLVSPHYTETISSMVCISDKEVLNFADIVDKSIHGFCNRAHSSITFDFHEI
ncbi:DUF3800 domain-containing protein [Aliivibrio fischeri]|uniref:DUF3800 domain-containing protein n=1 Tax=Aliivibrio fischeri TaxID=668 RepID=UPI002E300954|nr:DUF3800 domain-containing protein [Aliivibrio fischeri]MCE7535598.1 DUF3800 domain-containing protein [Aliivibrio fischeri]MCE7559236.1 DUF3800 domain-containing protein [Aliivibrio fischeri]